MIVQICIGSACHLKGSYSVIQTLNTLLEQEDLENRVTLKSSFCMGCCAGEVSVRIDDQPVTSVTPESTRDFFLSHIKGAL